MAPAEAGHGDPAITDKDIVIEFTRAQPFLAGDEVQGIVKIPLVKRSDIVGIKMRAFMELVLEPPPTMMKNRLPLGPRLPKGGTVLGNKISHVTHVVKETPVYALVQDRYIREMAGFGADFCDRPTADGRPEVREYPFALRPGPPRAMHSSFARSGCGFAVKYAVIAAVELPSGAVVEKKVAMDVRAAFKDRFPDSETTSRERASQCTRYFGAGNVTLSARLDEGAVPTPGSEFTLFVDVLNWTKKALTEILVRIKQVADVNALGLAYKRESVVFETKIDTQESGSIISYAKSTIALDLFMPEDAVPFQSGNVDVYWTVLLQGFIEDAPEAPLEVELPLTQALAATASKSRRSLATAPSSTGVADAPRRPRLERAGSVIRAALRLEEAAKEAKEAREKEAAEKERKEKGEEPPQRRRIVSFGMGGSDEEAAPSPEGGADKGAEGPTMGERPHSLKSSGSSKSLRLRRSLSRAGSRKTLPSESKRGFSVKVNHEAASRRMKQSMKQSATRKNLPGAPLNAKLSKTLGLVGLAAAAMMQAKKQKAAADKKAAAGGADGKGKAEGADAAAEAAAAGEEADAVKAMEGGKFKQAVRRVMYSRILRGRSDSMNSNRGGIMARARSDSLASSRSGASSRTPSGSMRAPRSDLSARMRTEGSLRGPAGSPARVRWGEGGEAPDGLAETTTDEEGGAAGGKRAPSVPRAPSAGGTPEGSMKRPLSASPSRKAPRAPTSKSQKASSSLLRFPLRSASRGEALEAARPAPPGPAEEPEAEAWPPGRPLSASGSVPSASSLAAAVAASLAAAAPGPAGGFLATMSIGPDALSDPASPRSPSSPAPPPFSFPAAPSPPPPPARPPRPLLVEPEEEEEEGAEAGAGGPGEPPSPGGGLIPPANAGYLSVIAEGDHENVSVASARSRTPPPSPGTQRRHVRASPLELPLPDVQPPVDLVLPVPPAPPSPRAPSPRSPAASSAPGSGALAGTALSDLPAPSPPLSPQPAAAAPRPPPVPPLLFVHVPSAPPNPRERPPSRPPSGRPASGRPERSGRPKSAGRTVNGFPAPPPAPPQPPGRVWVVPVVEPVVAPSWAPGLEPPRRPRPQSAREPPAPRRPSPERPRSARGASHSPRPHSHSPRPPARSGEDEYEEEEEEERAEREAWLRAERRVSAVAWTASGGLDGMGRPASRPAGAAMKAARQRPRNGLMRMPLELWGSDLLAPPPVDFHAARPRSPQPRPTPRPPSASAPHRRRPHSAGGAYGRRLTPEPGPVGPFLAFPAW